MDGWLCGILYSSCGLCGLVFVGYFSHMESQLNTYKWPNYKDSLWSWFKVLVDFHTYTDVSKASTVVGFFN